MKKPKTIKIILLAAAILTVVLFILAVVMLKAVKGDALFYMNSGEGYFYAVSYRWVCLAEGLLLLFWVILGVSRRKVIPAILFGVEPKKMGSEEVAVETGTTAGARMAEEKQAVEEAKATEEAQVATEVKGPEEMQATAETKSSAGAAEPV